MELFLHILCAALIGCGLLSFLGAAIGLIRFPDFYTRMHAAGKGDTLSTMLILAGTAVYLLSKIDPAEGNLIIILLVAIKIMAISGFIMLTSPTSTHALMQAGYDDDIDPVGEREEMHLDMPRLGAAKEKPDEVEEKAPEPEPAEEKPIAEEPVKKKTARKKAAAKKKSAAKKTATKKAVAKKAAAKKKSTGGRKKD